MNPVTSNLSSPWGLPWPIVKSHETEKWAWPWAMEAAQNLCFPFSIFVTTEDSDFKFGTHIGFAKGHHKITPRRKSRRDPGLGKLPKILGFPFNISARAEVSEFKFGTQLGFVKGHHKIRPRKKSGRGPGLGKLPKIWGFSLIFMQWLKVPTSNLVLRVGGLLGPS